MTITKRDKWSAGIIVFLLLIVAFQFCNRPKESTVTTIKDVQVKIPETTGVLSKPDKKTELPSAHTDSLRVDNHTYYSSHPFDKKQAAEYLKTKDSLKQAQMYISAIQEKENITDFSNDKLELKIYTKVSGQLKDIKVDYFKIKETTVTVQEKETIKTVTEPAKLKDVVSLNGHVGWLAGGTFQQDLSSQKPAYGVTAGIRIEKFTVLANINTNKQVGVTAVIEF